MLQPIKLILSPLLFIFMACQKQSSFYDLKEQQPCPEVAVVENKAPQLDNVIFEVWRYQASWESSQDVVRILQINSAGQFLRATSCGLWLGQHPLPELESWQNSLPKSEMQYFGDKKAMFYAGQPFTGMVLWLDGRKTEYYLSDSIPVNPYNTRFKKMWDSIIDNFPQVEVQWMEPVSNSSNSTLKPY